MLVSSDMALLGNNPGGWKFTFCLAEDEENSAALSHPLHVSRGFDADDSVVTVLGSEACPHVRLSMPVTAMIPIATNRYLNC